jgi:hypothetical protein
VTGTERLEMLKAGDTIRDLRAENERLRAALCNLGLEISNWAASRCPCEDDKPDPCPLCGARAESDACRALDASLPDRVLGALHRARELVQ